MKFDRRILCVAFSLFAGVAQASATPCTTTVGNLVANCGFETGSFSSWTVTGNQVPGQLGNLYGVEGTDPDDNIAPHSGSDQAFFATLDANATTLAQSIATIAGDNYTISFYAAQDTASTAHYGNELVAAFGSTTLASLSNVPVEGYTLYSYTTTASTASTALDLTFGNGLGEFLLDDVSVVPTAPEPSSWILMLAPAMAMMVRFRKRLTGFAGAAA